MSVQDTNNSHGTTKTEKIKKANPFENTFEKYRAFLNLLQSTISQMH